MRAAFQVIARDSPRFREMLPTTACLPDVIQIECDDPSRGIGRYCSWPGAVTVEGIDAILATATGSTETVSHVVFITNDPIEPVAREYAKGLHQSTGGIEWAVLDCVGFVRHFLHLFHRHRTAFLDAYQELVLAEPDSAVSFGAKQACLGLRQAVTDAANAGA